MRYRDVTQQVIGTAFAVHKQLGGGFLEKVYENALIIELRQSGLNVQQQYPVPVFSPDQFRQQRNRRRKFRKYRNPVNSEKSC